MVSRERKFTKKSQLQISGLITMALVPNYYFKDYKKNSKFECSNQ